MKLHTFIQSVSMVLTATVAAHGQPLDDPPVPGRAVMRVQVGESIDAGVQFQTTPFTTPTLRVTPITPAPC